LESLPESVAAALVCHKGKVTVGSKVSDAFKAYKKKAAGPQVGWNAAFLKSVKNRWKKRLLLKEDFDSAEEFLAGLVSRGKSTESIVSWLESQDICSGGDAACQKAVEFGWLVEAWDVPYSVLRSEVSESQNPTEMVEEGARIVADSLAKA
jgi:hypothetical protein